MYALLAGCHNIGSSVAQSFGAFMLESLGVTPNGTVGDADKMTNLWLASLVSSVVPLFSVFLAPYCVPDAFQTDTILLDAPDSATHGSPWERWTSSRRSDGSASTPTPASIHPLPPSADQNNPKAPNEESKPMLADF